MTSRRCRYRLRRGPRLRPGSGADPARARRWTRLAGERARRRGGRRHVNRERPSEQTPRRRPLAVEQHGRTGTSGLPVPEVGDLLEALARLAQLHRSARCGRDRAQAVRFEPACYDHLAGVLGTRLMAALIDRDLLVGGEASSGPARPTTTAFQPRDSTTTTGSPRVGSRSYSAFGIDFDTLPRRPAADPVLRRLERAAPSSRGRPGGHGGRADVRARLVPEDPAQSRGATHGRGTCRAGRDVRRRARSRAHLRLKPLRHTGRVSGTEIGLALSVCSRAWSRPSRRSRSCSPSAHAELVLGLLRCRRGRARTCGDRRRPRPSAHLASDRRAAPRRRRPVARIRPAVAAQGDSPRRRAQGAP